MRASFPVRPGNRAGRTRSRPGRPALAVSLALWLSAGAGGLAAQDDSGPRDELPATVRFQLEEPRPNPFQDRVEIPFVLGTGPELRWPSAVAGPGLGEPVEGHADARPARATVSIRIFNLLHQRVAWAAMAPWESRSGRLVRDLRFEVPGRYTAMWDGRAEDGYRVPSGPYFVEIAVDGWTAVGKVLLTR